MHPIDSLITDKKSSEEEMMGQRVRKYKEGSSRHQKHPSQPVHVRDKGFTSPERDPLLFRANQLPVIMPTNILSLQRLIGNQAIQRLLIKQQQDASADSRLIIQPKLTINTPGNRYEQEANDVAAQAAERLNSAQRTIKQRQSEKAVKLTVQRSASDNGVAAHPAMVAGIEAARGRGHPLSPDVRVPMEQTIGADFSGVRVHTDSEANELNQSLQSHAFATGQDIFFLEGKYAPDNPSGQALLAHELAHTVQQDAHTRIAPWAPAGHRQVTEKAFLDGALARRYAKELQLLLIERSPEMDYIQDQQHDMNKGIEESTENISAYKQKTKEFLKTKDRSRAKQLRVELDQMWIENTLHRRDTNYMRMHGEAGEYKINVGPAAAINRAVTVEFVNKAAGLYNTGNVQDAIEVLGDAIHQAEDRGSHFEGTQGLGHDARQKIKLKERVPAHRSKFRGVPAIPYIKNPTPDNSKVNSDGAQRAIGYAQDVLHYFASKVKGVISSPSLSKRRITKFGLTTHSKGKATKLAENFVGGLKTKKGISKLGPQHKKDREGLEGVSSTQESRDAIKYYLAGQQKQKAQDEYRLAKMKFQSFNKAVWRGGKSKSARIKESKAYYNGQIDPLKKENQGIALAIKDAFRLSSSQVLDVPADDYAGGTRNDDQYKACLEDFEIIASLCDDEDLIPFFAGKLQEMGKEYYKDRIQPRHEAIELIGGAIKKAYSDVFGTELF
jgi:hypothetical protein